MNNEVSGAHRFKFFSNAFALPHSPPSAIFCIENEEGKGQDQELKSCQAQAKKLKEAVVQTKLSLPQINVVRKYSRKQKANPKQPLGGKHVRKEREMPPVSKFGSIEEYKAFLIQVQMDDIKTREKQINKDIEHRLKEKKKELEERYSKRVMQNCEKIETAIIERKRNQDQVMTHTKNNTVQTKVKSCANLFTSRRYPNHERRETSKRKLDEHKNSLEYIESIM